MNKLTLLLVLPLVYGCQQVNDTTSSVVAHGIEWFSDQNDVNAGAILVPENHDDPEGRKIQITYLVIKARDTTSAAFPVIYFTGGPGGNSIDEGAIEFFKNQPINNEHDIILFDQRGIGYSSALPDMAYGSWDVMAADANEEEELILMSSLIEEYKKKCSDQNIGLEFYNTHQNAKDVGMLFKHLGYEKYNLQGGSYGTRLGRVVQDKFPEYVNSSVLDSPAPLSGDFLLDRFDSYSLSLGRIFEYCDGNPECKNDYPNLKDEYFKAIAQLQEKPLSIKMNDSVTVHINAQDGIYLLRRLLYQGDSRERAPKLIRAFLEGTGEVIDQVLEIETGMTEGLNLSMLLSVEKYEMFNPANTAAVINEHYEKYPLIPVKLGFFDAFYQAGVNWHSASLPMEDRGFQNSDIPTLILVNKYDPVTPPKNGYLFKETLSNATLLVLDEGGHGGGNRECKASVILEFMDNPTGTLDTSCLNIFDEVK